MKQETILALVAVAAIAYAIGFHRGAARSTQAQPVMLGSGTDWLNWQGA